MDFRFAIYEWKEEKSLDNRLSSFVIRHLTFDIAPALLLFLRLKPTSGKVRGSGSPGAL